MLQLLGHLPSVNPVLRRHANMAAVNAQDVKAPVYAYRVTEELAQLGPH